MTMMDLYFIDLLNFRRIQIPKKHFFMKWAYIYNLSTVEPKP